jgi:hypothetical protein
LKVTVMLSGRPWSMSQPYSARWALSFIQAG